MFSTPSNFGIASNVQASELECPKFTTTQNNHRAEIKRERVRMYAFPHVFSDKQKHMNRC